MTMYPVSLFPSFQGKGKGKGKSASAVVNSLADESREMIPVRRLRMLDVFAGCGGRCLLAVGVGVWWLWG